MARYESWKLADVTTSGFIAHWTVRAKQRILTGRAFLPESTVVSLRRMNRNALIMDGEEPVITE